MSRPGAGPAALALLLASAPAAAGPYAWLELVPPGQSLAERLAPPAGYSRPDAPAGSFAAWLRGLPLRPGRPPVRLHDGRLKANQDAHEAVLELDVGQRDLQQCADAVLRLRAEYLWSRGALRDLRFRFTSGDESALLRWFEGFRPVPAGAGVRFERRAAPAQSYQAFRGWLENLFVYAGSFSLGRELRPLRSPAELRAGDVFVQGGFPGHAVLVLDRAVGPGGEAAVLLAQSFMPAQDVHVLRNPAAAGRGPWFEVGAGEALRTPEWTFAWSDAGRFAPAAGEPVE